MGTGPTGRPPLFSLAAASAAALAYQLQLVRLFSIIQWHHFAYMIISLALLGYGASGTFLSLVRPRIEPRLRTAYVLTIAMFAVTAVPAFLLAQALVFSPEELLWRPSMIWRLVSIYFTLGTPFFFVACAVGLAYMGWGHRANRVYATDLAGAACGGLVAIALTWWMNPLDGLGAAAGLGVMAAIVAAMETRQGRPWIAALAAMYVAAVVIAPEPRLRLSPYKDLASALQVSGAEIIQVRSSPWGMVTVVRNELVPFRDAPGMGLKATAEPPDQLALFHDGNFDSTITRDSGEEQPLRFLASLPSAAPYEISRPDRVLVLEAGGGLLALQAKYLGAGHVTAVEGNPDVVDLVREQYRAYSGGLYAPPPVSVARAHPRWFLARDEETWDLIQLPATGGLGVGAAGLFALSEDYLRTTEALASMIDRLSPGGILCVQAWETLPPRASLRLAATLIDALRRHGVEAPGDRLAVIRSWQMAVLLVRNGRFSSADLAALGTFASSWGYDLAWYEGMSRDQARSGLNRTREPWLYDGVSAFVTSDDDFLKNYKFDVRPATDSRPFFNNYLRWGTIREAFALLGTGGMPLLEAGYIMLLATLAQALLLAVVLCLLPLAGSGSHRARSRNGGRPAATAAFFGAIGLAFMLIEVAAIHRFILFLEEPILASAVVVSAFLVFAGIGGLTAGGLVVRFGARSTARTAAVAVAILGTGWLTLVGLATDAGASLGIVARMVVTIALVAPLAFAMGHLFPAAMGELSESSPTLVPWAWAVNGCASVTGAVLATVVAMATGFEGCMLVAVLLYLITLVCFPARVPALSR